MLYFGRLSLPTHILFSLLDFLSKLAALVPRPRHNLVRYHGIFAPNSKMRKLIVPKSSTTVKRAREEHSKTHKMAEEAARRDELVAPLTWAQRLKRVFDGAAVESTLPNAPCVAAPCASSPTSLIQTSSRKYWITSKRNLLQLNLQQQSNPKTCFDKQAKITPACLKKLRRDQPSTL